MKLKNCKTCNGCLGLDYLGGERYRCGFGFSIGCLKEEPGTHQTDIYPQEPCPKPTTRTEHKELVLEVLNAEKLTQVSTD